MATETNYDAIMSEIKAGRFKPVYVLMGEEPYFIDKLEEAIVQYALSEEDKVFCHNVMYGTDVLARDVINAARTFPMGERQVVVARRANEIRDIDELTFYLSNPQPSTVLVLENKVGKFDGRKKFMTLAKKIGVVYEAKRVNESQLPAYISSYLKEKGYTIDAKSVGIIAESIGSDLVRLYGEMDKLIGAMGEKNREVTPDVVEQHIGISKDFNIFEFQNALITKNATKAYQIAKYFDDNQKQNPIQKILPTLFKTFSQLMTAYYAPGRDKHTLANYLGMQEWQVERNILPALRNFPAVKVLNILMAIR